MFLMKMIYFANGCNIFTNVFKINRFHKNAFLNAFTFYLNT